MNFTLVPPMQLPILLAPDPRFGPWAVVPQFVVLDDEERTVRCSGMTIDWCPMMLARDAGDAFATRDADGYVLEDDASTVPWEIASPETMPPPDELTSTVVRSIAVATQVARARASLIDLQNIVNAMSAWAAGVDEESRPAHEPTNIITEARRRRPREHAAEHYREVAAVYGGASTRPRQAVAEHFDVRPATASDYIREARRREFLPPTTRGKATNNDEPPSGKDRARGKA